MHPTFPSARWTLLHRRPVARAAAALLAAVLLIPAAGSAQGQSAESPEITEQALAQIAVLMAEKAGRSPAEKKLASGLLFERAKRRGDRRFDTLPNLRTGVQVAGDGRVLVDLDAEVGPALLAQIETLGGTVVNAHSRFDAVRAHLPLDRLTELAAAEAVRSVRPADVAMTQMINTTEGDVAHGTDVVRTNFGVDGTGVQVGAMSDSVDALATLQASGDLPAGVTVIPGQSGNPGTSEGTALLEIVHDMAPGADLFYATGVGGQAQMAQNILDLAAAGCDIIVDDILYLAEPVFQDGVIAQAVDQVVAAGVMFFSAAGNSGNLTNGESGVFEGDFVPTALPAPLVGNAIAAHDFGGGANSNEITADPPALITLQWSDPQDGSANDYDLFVLDAALANVLAASTSTQDGTQDPIEGVNSAGDDTGNRIVVTQFAGDGRFLHLNTHRGRLDVGTNGQIFGHPAARGAMAVGAVDVATANGGQFTGGAANPAEFFTSDGPRRIFFEADGSPVPAGPELLRGGQTSTVRQKPDVVAGDGVSTATPGFNPFFGSSASAPHSAGMSALYEELFPSVSPFDAYDLFRSSALDIEDPGIDDISGNGIMMIEEPMNNTIFADGFESGNTSAWTK
ncbi:MAG: S8 family serine peptidase [Acidobacteriota bacterium]